MHGRIGPGNSEPEQALTEDLRGSHLPRNPVQVEREHEGLASCAGRCKGGLTARMPTPHHYHVIVLLVIPRLPSKRGTGLQVTKWSQ